MNPELIKTRDAEGDIGKYRFVAHGANDYGRVQASSATSLITGTTDHGAKAGGRVDETLSGLSDIEYGGTVAAGDPLTSDATGRAIKANPGSGANVRIGGYATVSGVLGDIGEVHVIPQQIQG